MCDVYQLPSPALYLLHPHSGVSLKTHYQVFTQHNTLYLLQPDQNFLMKVKVKDLEGLLIDCGADPPQTIWKMFNIFKFFLWLP